MSEILAQAVDICRKLIGEKTTPDVSEIDSAITNITYIPMFKDVDQSVLPMSASARRKRFLPVPRCG